MSSSDGMQAGVSNSRYEFVLSIHIVSFCEEKD